MTHPRPGRVAPIIALLSLAFAGQALLAQTETLEAIGDEQTPSELYRDVKALRLVAELQLSDAQIAKILPVVQQVTAQAVADGQADDAAWELVESAADNVIRALIAQQQPARADAARLDQAATERNARENFRAGMAAQAAIAIQRMLTGEQAARIETAGEQADRKELEARLGGEETPLDYIVMKLEEQVQLMPDEYVRIREARALEMAEILLGPDAPGLRRLAGALLAVMNDVASWTMAQYAQRRPTLREDVAEALAVPDLPAQHLVKYDEFIEWITSDRTVPVLQELLAVARATEDEEEAVTP